MHLIMDASDESVENSSDETDAESSSESDTSDGPVCSKPKTEDAGDCMEKDRKRMDQLVSDLTAERDRIEHESGIQCQAGASVGRNAEYVTLANKHMEEAHNYLSRVWMTPGPINQLPLECFAHVMSFIPIQQVFVCMSVSKKWEEAARLTVRKHKRLQLVSKHIWHPKLQIHNPMDLIVVNNWSKKAQKLRRLTRSLLLIEKLEHLKASDCPIMDREDINPVIVKNAASLLVLNTAENLPSSEQGPVIYRQLKELDCRSLSHGIQCPVLEDLTIYPCCSLGPVDHLPILTMRKFVCHLNSPDEADDSGLCFIHDGYEPTPIIAQKILQAAKRLVHLTHLTINSVVTDVPVDDVSTIMDNFTSLVHLELQLPFADFEFDQKVDQLVRRNPGLQKLVFYHLNLSDAALTSIARLHELQHLRLLGEDGFTVNGVLTLLRSLLRPLLRVTRFDVEMTDEGRKEIFDEIDLIAAERGRAVTVTGREQGDWYGETIAFNFEGLIQLV